MIENNETLVDEPTEPGDTVDAGVAVLGPDSVGTDAVAGVRNTAEMDADVPADAGVGVGVGTGARDTAIVVVEAAIQDPAIAGAGVAVSVASVCDRDTASGEGAVAKDTAGTVISVDGGACADAERESKPRKKRRGQGSRKNKLKNKKTAL